MLARARPAIRRRRPRAGRTSATRRRARADGRQLSGHGRNRSRRSAALATMTPGGTAVPSLVMDPPTRTRHPALAPLARALAEGERLREFLDEPGGRAGLRADPPALPRRVSIGPRRAARLRLPGRRRRRGTRPRPRAGSSARSRSDSSRRAASAGGAASSRRRTWWASGPGRSRCSPAGGLVCASAVGATEGVPPREAATGADRASASATSRASKALAERLALAGYERVPQAEERGQFAVRGGIVDVFPPTGREPVRLELFGDEIESLRAFSPFTQRTLHALEEADVYPAAERRLDLRRAGARRGRRGRRPFRPTSSRRCPAPDLVWQADEAEEAVREELGVELDLRRRDPPLRSSRRASPTRSRRSAPPSPRAGSPRPSATCSPTSGAGTGSSSRSRTAARRCGRRGCSAGSRPSCSSPETTCPDEPGLFFVGLARAARVRPPRPRRHPPPGHAGLPQAAAACGRPRGSRAAELRRPAHRRPRRPRGPRRREAARLRDEDGRRRHARLPLPRVQGRRPPLRPARADRQGVALRRRRTGTRRRSRSSAARRGRRSRTARGRARTSSPASCSPSTRSASAPRASPSRPTASSSSGSRPSFAYEETPDQRQAIEAVKEDLEAPRPMDRLVCGDVGFGKTEVAVRAAFIAVANGTQALMLAPTTILAQQHWNTFRERYRDLPVTVEMVSRFRRPADVKRVLADFAAGKVDVLIGTHRVLSRDVVSKNLGLVIVDEEQRFGVAQKELLRQLRLEVDVLALSATPIPRTLHMSLAGLRDISVIETPPQGRRPIRTHVGEYDEELVREALVREHERERPVVLPPQPGRDDRRGGRAPAAALPRAALPRRPRPDAGAGARGAHALVPRRRRRRARLDDDHRVGPRHPAGEHAGRRAGGHARARPALPDPRPRRAGATSSPTRTSSIPTGRS